LSVHRAIAVKGVLSRAGIAPVRLSVAGYGQFRPVVPNDSQGARANRRVEIFLVPYSYTAVEAVAADEPAASPEPDAATAAAPEAGDTEPEAFK
jgi:chemotaxis protein MotB